MAKTILNGIYKCNICGNMVEMIKVGKGELVCCGQPMELLEEKNQDEGMEKHVPVVEKIDKGFLVKVGSIPHPMEEAHYIEWIEMVIDEKKYRHFLKPGQAPETVFSFGLDIKSFSVRIYCNIHGLWSKVFQF